MTIPRNTTDKELEGQPVKECAECEHIILPGTGAPYGNCYVNYGCGMRVGFTTSPGNDYAIACPFAEPKRKPK